MKLAYQNDRKKNATLFSFRHLSEDEIRELQAGQRVLVKLNNGRVGEVKINGAVRTWKRDPTRLEVPVKYGMYETTTFSLEEAKNRFLKSSDD